MTRAPLLLPVLLILAACGRNDPLPPADNPAEATCRREAEASPAAKAGYARLPPADNVTQFNRVKAEIAAAERAAYLRCMRDKGLAPPGGVEPVRPPG
ncbi:hypothetical protein [Muricoccus aerilatus]|uniref:hypothetical protein n=1 Tax=Muricoccus aerilatus TaxID=452982 RepID=UPI0005C14238|nr:hypothetical protein [Roseomonas aerilata]